MIEDDLFKVKEADYKGNYQDHLLSQYRLYVGSAEKISDRRQRTNDFFLTLNSAILAFLGYSVVQSEGRFNLMTIFSLAGIVICYFWYRIIRSYKNINSGKFKVIHIIEKKLPLALYDTEWTALDRGENPKTYLPFTHIEIKVPWAFIILYFLLILVRIILSIPWNSLCFKIIIN